MGRPKKKFSVEPPAPQYPVIYKILWRFVRVGLSAGISSALAVQVVLDPDWSNSKAVLLTLSSAFATGFLSAAAMALRDFVSQGDSQSPIQKLPL